MPYYVASMWMKTEDKKTLVAALYGPSVLNTSIAGTQIEITQKTLYPLRIDIELYLKPEKRSYYYC